MGISARLCTIIIAAIYISVSLVNIKLLWTDFCQIDFLSSLLSCIKECSRHVEVILLICVLDAAWSSTIQPEMHRFFFRNLNIHSLEVPLRPFDTCVSL